MPRPERKIVNPPPRAAAAGEPALIGRVRGGDEAFGALLDRHAPSVLRLALALSQSRAEAEQVAQETWLVVISDLEGFGTDSSPRARIFGILAGKAGFRAVRERRPAPFTALTATEGADVPCVDPGRFVPADGSRRARHWATPPRRWEQAAERSPESAQATRLMRDAVDALDPMQRLVITMRDLEHWDAGEVCDALAISGSHQRALLHRARATVRAALERHFDADPVDLID